MTNATQKKTNAKKSTAKSKTNSKTQNLMTLAQINQTQAEIKNAETAHEKSFQKANAAIAKELDKQKNKLEKAKAVLKALKEKTAKSKSAAKNTKAFQINQDKTEAQKKAVDDLTHAVKSLKLELEELKQAERYYQGKQKAIARFDKEFAKSLEQAKTKQGNKQTKKKPSKKSAQTEAATSNPTISNEAAGEKVNKATGN